MEETFLIFVYIPVPLETSYQSAWDAVPTFW
jgi:hypothetical protein